MPIATGSLALKRFQILTHGKDLSIPWIMENLSKAFISPLHIDDGREEANGFCHPFTGEPKIEYPHSLVFDQFFLFGMRSDRKKIPATFMKLQLRNALEALGHEKEDSQGNKKKIGKKVRDNIKDKLKEELLKSSIPSVKLTEILWNLKDNQIWITSTSPSSITEFEKLFSEAFDLPIVLINPGTASLDFEKIQLNLNTDMQPYLDLSPVSLANKFHFERKNETSNETEPSQPVF